MNDVALSGPILLGYYLVVGVLVGVWSFCWALTQGMREGEEPGSNLATSLLLGTSAVFLWPWVVKVLYDSRDGDWRG